MHVQCIKVLFYCTCIQGCTSLMRACQHGHLQSLEQLAMKGLPMQGKLTSFCWLKNNAIIISLVADGGGLRALFHCLHPTGRHVKCLSFLLDHGAEPNTKVLLYSPLFIFSFLFWLSRRAGHCSLTVFVFILYLLTCTVHVLCLYFQWLAQLLSLLTYQ